MGFALAWQHVMVVRFYPHAAQRDVSASVHNTPEAIDLQLKTGRLTKRPEFLYIAKNGKKWVSDTVIVQVLETDRGEIRFGFTATKKIGNAVIRNRAKRRMRAAADYISKTQSIKSADIVLIARDTVATCDWDDLVKNLGWCLKCLNCL